MFEEFPEEEMSEDVVVSESLRSVVGGDAERLMKRFSGLAQALSRAALGRVKVVFHTEYGLPLRRGEAFRGVYLDAASKLVNDLSRGLRAYRLNGDSVVGVHPGFTGLKVCSYRGGRLRCRDVERDLKRRS